MTDCAAPHQRCIPAKHENIIRPKGEQLRSRKVAAERVQRGPFRKEMTRAQVFSLVIHSATVMTQCPLVPFGALLKFDLPLRAIFSPKSFFCDFFWMRRGGGGGIFFHT